MINPQELRIGNLVKGPQGIERITDIGETLVRCELHDNLGGFTRHWKEIDPIPITPEILEKIKEVEGDMIETEFGVIDCRPYVLHKLQNSYYALTEKELTINL